MSKETSGNDTKEEKDKPKKKDGQPTEQWGLDRIDQRNVPLDGVFSVKRKERWIMDHHAYNFYLP